MTSTFKMHLVRILAVSLAAVPALATVISVPADPSDPDGNCSNLITQINSIPSSSKNDSFEILIGPGRYRCNGATIVLKDWVNLVGTGIETTFVEGSGAFDSIANSNVLIRGASSSEIRDLSLEMNNPAVNSVGVFLYEAQSRIDNVEILLFRGAADCVGILAQADQSFAGQQPFKPVLRNSFVDAKKCRNNYGFRVKGKVLPKIRRSYLMASNASGAHNVGLQFYQTDAIKNSNTITLRDIEIGAYGKLDDAAECYAVAFENVIRMWKVSFFNAYLKADRCTNANVGVETASPVFSAHNIFLHDTHIKALKGNPGRNDVGIKADGSGVKVEMYGGSIHTQGPPLESLNSATIHVGAAQLSGTAVGTSPTIKCAGVYDESFSFFASVCP